MMNKAIGLAAAMSALLYSGMAVAGVHWSVGINVGPPVVYAPSPVYLPAPVYYEPRVVYGAPVPIYSAPTYYYGAPVIYGPPVYVGAWGGYGYRRGWGHGHWRRQHGR